VALCVTVTTAAATMGTRVPRWVGEMAAALKSNAADWRSATDGERRRAALLLSRRPHRRGGGGETTSEAR